MRTEIPDLVYDIWLAQALGTANVSVTAIFDRFETARDFYSHLPDSLDGLEGMRPGTKRRLENLDLGSAQAIYEDCLKKKYHIISCKDPLYPQNLLEIPDYPVVLYGAGNLKALEHGLFFGVVGTREPSRYGLLVAGLLAYDLAVAGFTVVSGLARGIDYYAHQECIRGGGYTVAFVGNGLDSRYPAANQELRRQIERRGLVLSELPPEIRGGGRYFPIRNRLVSGMSEGVLLAEGGRRSGALITGRHALYQNRDVFVVPGDIFDERFEGTFRFLREGAVPVMSAAEIVLHYMESYPERLTVENVRPNFYREDWRKNPPKLPGGKTSNLENPDESFKKSSNLESTITHTEPKPKKTPENLSIEARKVLDVMEKHRMHVDVIREKSGLEPAGLMVALTELEMESLIAGHPGKFYSRI